MPIPRGETVMAALRYMTSAHGKTNQHRLSCTNVLLDTPEALVVCMTPYRKRGRKDRSFNLCANCLKSHYLKERYRNAR